MTRAFAWSLAGEPPDDHEHRQQRGVAGRVGTPAVIPATTNTIVGVRPRDAGLFLASNPSFAPAEDRRWVRDDFEPTAEAPVEEGRHGHAPG